MNKQAGASMVLMAFALVSLIGFMGLAIDVGYVLVVRNELQNAADAAALTGAKYLYPLNGIFLAGFPDPLTPRMYPGQPPFQQAQDVLAPALR